MKIFSIFLLLLVHRQASGFTQNFECNSGFFTFCTASAAPDFSDGDSANIFAGEFEFSGTGLTADDIAVIIFDIPYCSTLTTIPQGLETIFPNFIALNFNGCPIDEVNANDLQNYPNLETFSLSDSDLTKIPENFFASTPNLKSVGITLTKLVEVGSGLLDSLSSLETADFSNNVCINLVESSPEDVQAVKDQLAANCTIEEPPKCALNDTNENIICDLLEAVEALENADEALNTSITALSTDVEALESQVSDLSEANQNLTEVVENLKNQTAELKMENEKLDQQVEALKNETGELEEKQKELEDEVDALKSEIDELKGEVANLEAENENLKCLLAALGGKVEKLEEFFNPSGKIFIRTGYSFISSH